MVDLTRTVRFCVNDGEPTDRQSGGDNTFAGAPSMRGIGRWYELEVRCRGEVDPRTGYFLNIREIDQAVREVAVPRIARACHESPGAHPAAALREALGPLNQRLGCSVRAARWRLTPYYSLEMRPGDHTTVLLRQQFDFAASHRLHVPSLSDEQNRRLFGKCNNPRGHGHNYRVEPCVRVAVSPEGEPALTLVDLERITARTILDRFDHKHLNEDTAEFAAINPSVENIARVCYELLAPEVRAATRAIGAGAATRGGADLVCVTVWETDKTSCTYPPLAP